MRLLIFFLLLASTAGAQPLKATVTSSSEQAQYAKFNLTKTAVTYSDWTNVAGDPHLAIRTATGHGGVTFSSVATANWYPYANTTAYNGGGSTGGMFFPSEVLVNHWYQYSTPANYDAAKWQIEIGGLYTTATYNIAISGNDNSGFDANPVRIRIVGASDYGTQDYDADNNINPLSNGVNFQFMSPDGSGKFKIYVNTVGSTSNLTSISGVVVVKN